MCGGHLGLVQPPGMIPEHFLSPGVLRAGGGALGLSPGRGGTRGWGGCHYLSREMKEAKQNWGELSVASKRRGQGRWGLPTRKGFGIWLGSAKG